MYTRSTGGRHSYLGCIIAVYGHTIGIRNVHVSNAGTGYVRSLHIYYCMTGRAIWGNIQLEGGSIGPTEGRDNTEPES